MHTERVQSNDYNKFILSLLWPLSGYGGLLRMYLSTLTSPAVLEVIPAVCASYNRTSSSTSLLQCVFLIQSLPIASNKVFADVFGWADRIVSRWIAIPAYDLSDVFELGNRAYNAVMAYS